MSTVEITPEPRKRGRRPASQEQKTRANEPTREDQAAVFDFGPQASLKAPKPRDGYMQRWVRAELLGEADAPNLQRQEAMGWTPRRADTVADNKVSRYALNKDGSIIQSRGMILMERPVEVNQQHRAYIDNLTQGQLSRVKYDLDRSAYVKAGMRPFVEKDSSIIEKGRPTRVADDDF